MVKHHRNQSYLGETRNRAVCSVLTAFDVGDLQQPLRQGPSVPVHPMAQGKENACLAFLRVVRDTPEGTSQRGLGREGSGQQLRRKKTKTMNS